jgi:ABC-type amino acid transport substrate-binding protein
MTDDSATSMLQDLVLETLNLGPEARQIARPSGRPPRYHVSGAKGDLVTNRLFAAGASLLLIALPAAAPAADFPAIQARGSLKVIAGEGEQPEMFTFGPAPARPGFEREMLEGFCRLKRLKLEAVPVKSFAERIPALLRGDGDLIMGMVDTPERRKQIDFTVEVIPVRHLVVTRKPAPPVQTIEEFRKKKAGTIRDTTWARETRATGIPESQIEYFADTEPMLEALDAGRVDEVVMTISDFALASTRHPDLEAGLFVGEAQHAAWGVRKGDQKLKAELDAYLDNLRSGASWSRLVVKYFGDKTLTVLGRR